MSTFFVDTSALAKRYFIEPGSAWVKSWIEPRAANYIVISELSTIEMMGVFAFQIRAGTLSIRDANQLKKDFNIHVKTQYRLIPLKKRLFNHARRLLLKHPLRTLDAIQLASAIVAAQTLNVRPTFITGDQRLLTAAAAEGFPTDNPYNHP